MAGGGPATTQTTSTTQPPAYAVPYFQNYLSTLQQQIQPGSSVDPKTGKITGGTLAPSPYPNQQVAPFSPAQQEAMNAVNQFGPVSPLTNAAQQQQGATIGGAYLGPNPYLNDYYNQAAQNLVANYQTSISPDITAEAVSHGALGGSGQAQSQDFARYELGTNLGNLAAQIYEPAYQYERGLQQNAAQQTPSLVSSQYIPAQAMLQTGGQQQSQLQNILNTAVSNLTRQNLWPYTAISQLGQGLGTVSGGSQTVVQPNLSQGIK